MARTRRLPDQPPAAPDVGQIPADDLAAKQSVCDGIDYYPSEHRLVLTFGDGSQLTKILTVRGGICLKTVARQIR